MRSGKGDKGLRRQGCGGIRWRRRSGKGLMLKIWDRCGDSGFWMRECGATMLEVWEWGDDV